MYKRNDASWILCNTCVTQNVKIFKNLLRIEHHCTQKAARCLQSPPHRGVDLVSCPIFSLHLWLPPVHLDCILQSSFQTMCHGHWPWWKGFQHPDKSYCLWKPHIPDFGAPSAEGISSQGIILHSVPHSPPTLLNQEITVALEQEPISFLRLSLKKKKKKPDTERLKQHTCFPLLFWKLQVQD